MRFKISPKWDSELLNQIIKEAAFAFFAVPAIGAPDGFNPIIVIRNKAWSGNGATPMNGIRIGYDADGLINCAAIVYDEQWESRITKRSTDVTAFLRQWLTSKKMHHFILDDAPPQLADYLPFYIGQEAWNFTVKSCNADWLGEQLTANPTLRYKTLITLEGIPAILRDGYLPLLRPLRAIDETEHAEYYYRWRGPMDGVAALDQIYMAEARGVRYLLSRGFDVFGLIPLGLALDASKLEAHITAK